MSTAEHYRNSLAVVTEALVGHVEILKHPHNPQETITALEALKAH
jgi:hypothetical protein